MRVRGRCVSAAGSQSLQGYERSDTGMDVEAVCLTSICACIDFQRKTTNKRNI